MFEQESIMSLPIFHRFDYYTLGGKDVAIENALVLLFSELFVFVLHAMALDRDDDLFSLVQFYLRLNVHKYAHNVAKTFLHIARMIRGSSSTNEFKVIDNWNVRSFIFSQKRERHTALKHPRFSEPLPANRIPYLYKPK